MSFSILLFVSALCIGSTCCTTTVATTAEPPADVILITNPSVISCSFSPSALKEIVSFISLTLSRSPLPKDDIFSEVAMVTTFGGNIVDIKDTSMGGSISASSNGANRTLLFEWHYPAQAASGKYKCEAFGLDKDGHPVTSASVLILVTQNSNLPSAVHEIQALQIERNECLAQVSDWKSTVWGILYQSNSTEFNVTGHRYYLSQPIQANYTYADQLCSILGGYLAEIESYEEYMFVITYLATVARNQRVQIGASDLLSEGTWTYFHSEHHVNYFKWADNYPNNAVTDDCLGLYVYHSYDVTYAATGMVDQCCNGCSTQSFLCELE